jgi:hypothetical protein
LALWTLGCIGEIPSESLVYGDRKDGDGAGRTLWWNLKAAAFRLLLRFERFEIDHTWDLSCQSLCSTDEVNNRKAKSGPKRLRRWIQDGGHTSQAHRRILAFHAVDVSLHGKYGGIKNASEDAMRGKNA